MSKHARKLARKLAQSAAATTIQAPANDGSQARCDCGWELPEAAGVTFVDDTSKDAHFILAITCPICGCVYKDIFESKSKPEPGDEGPTSAQTRIRCNVSIIDNYRYLVVRTAA